MFRYLAEQATVPIGCHIDRARTVEECGEGIEHGFSSVMIDESMLDLRANIDLTAQVISVAKPQNISVEGEVGVVGYANSPVSLHTSPNDAAAFENETGFDALAISIGNLHLQTEQAAEIDLASLRAIEG